MEPDMRPRFRMSKDMKLGAPTIRTEDIDDMLLFYELKLGLKVTKKLLKDGSETFELRTSPQKDTAPLMILEHKQGYDRSPRNAAGLYHCGILLPTRRDLACVFAELGNSGVETEGYADHIASEAIYLKDPEGNGIEIYADRPASSWKFDINGRLRMDTLHLDTESLLDELSGDELETDSVSLPAGAKIGNMHLKVTDIDNSIQFYARKLGLDMVMQLTGAAFMSVNGYHHHMAVNTWESAGGYARAPNYSGLGTVKIIVPKDFIGVLASGLDRSAVSKLDENGLWLSDPDGISILIAAQ
ncbi:MAG: VOC family protein [Candidatus Micrarchaeaceae archaeon]